MANFDLVIHGGQVVSPSDVLACDVAISDGCLAALEPGLAGRGRTQIDAAGLHIFPGVIDSHVHLNEPGRTHWEGFETGSRALAAGGATLLFDMPLNASPPTLDAASFDVKRAAAEASSVIDFAFWGGLVPGNLDQLESLAERGVIGFKAFMSHSGIDDFPRADDRVLRQGMQRAAALGKVVAVHAESDEITRELSARRVAAGQTSVRDYLDSRPIHAELDAIERALALAGETGCALHIVHISCAAGIALVASAQKLGVDVTCETCPHYLALTEDDMLRLGALAKCAPPLRPAAAQAALWRCVESGLVTTIGSDHSPAPAELKQDANFFRVWGGISGAQHLLPLLLTEGHVRREIVLPLICRLTSHNVADRFRLPATKGRLVPGADADLALVDLRATYTVVPHELHYRHSHSPYSGRALTGRIIRTILRGQTVFVEGAFAPDRRARLVKPRLPVTP